MTTEYIAVAVDRLSKIEDVAVCNSYSLACREAESFAKSAPEHSIITVYEAREMKVISGRIVETETPAQ